jgi:BirA family biotin operon repressor/biotin-[acetyl-CoA-carboxylase] ligase
MNETRRALLDELAAGPVSGTAFAEERGVSRAAVWKQVEALREEGFDIDSTAEGYVVTAVPDYGAAAIAYGLDAPFDVEYHDSVGSTNDRGRELAAAGETDVVVVADEQTGSRGRLRRAWNAPSGGVWLSAVVRPDVPPAHAPAFTLASAVAATRVCREAGVEAVIKWPNDVLVAPESDVEPVATERGGRKLAGVLTEMEGEADRVSWLVVGLGLNANVDAADLPADATSLREQLGEDVDRRRFVQRVLERLDEYRGDLPAVVDDWADYAGTLNRRVRVETATGTFEGVAVGVEFPGALVVERDDGTRETVHAGECEHLRPT